MSFARQLLTHKCRVDIHFVTSNTCHRQNSAQDACVLGETIVFRDFGHWIRELNPCIIALYKNYVSFEYVDLGADVGGCYIPTDE
jgi:hypothetical protein